MSSRLGCVSLVLAPPIAIRLAPPRPRTYAVSTIECYYIKGVDYQLMRVVSLFSTLAGHIILFEYEYQFNFANINIMDYI